MEQDFVARTALDEMDQITNLIAVMQMIKIMNEEPSGGENP